MTVNDSSITSSRHWSRDPWFWVVLAVALLLRGAYLLDLRHTPFFASPQMDALYHDQWARRLAAGDWWGSDVFFRAPLYPYLLGLWYALAGTDPLPVRLLQFGVGAVTAGLTYLAARPRVGRAGALVAGGLVALSGPLIYFEGELLLVVLEAPLFLLTAWSLDVAWRERRPSCWLWAGAWLGLSALVRPITLALVPVVVPVLLVRRRRGGIRAAILYVVGASLLVSPVLVRNWVVGKDLVPVASQGGLNYYLGNNPNADGRAALAPEFRQTWFGGLEDSRWQAEQAMGRSLKPSEISAYWGGLALSWAREHPGDWLRLQVRKLAYFWDAFEIPNNQDYTYFSRLARIYRIPLLLGFGVLAPLAVAGWWVGARRRSLSWVWWTVPLVLMAVIVAFFVCGRFRASLIPVFAVGAGALVPGCLALWRERRWRSLAIAAALLAGVSVFANGDWFGQRRAWSPAESLLRIGVHQAAAGNLEAAADSYERALRARPGFADGWNNLGVVRAEQGLRDDAYAAFTRALETDPTHAKAAANLAKLLAESGDAERATSLARQVLEAAHSEAASLKTAATLLGNYGHFAEARDGFLRVVERAPEDPAGYLGAARAFLYLDQPGAALELLRRCPEARRTREIESLIRELSGP